jgi:FdhE protein
MGRVDRAHRGDDLPLRPGGAPDAGASEATGISQQLMLTRDGWLARHPYLGTVDAVEDGVSRAVEGLGIPAAGPPPFDAYREDFHRGIPLLKSTSGADVTPVESLVLTLVERLAASGLPGTLPAECRVLQRALRDEEAADSLAHGGVLRYLGCAVLARYLSPVVADFAAWRDEERWLRNYCPTCGSPPAMAQLVGRDPGRLRLLSCGCCRTRWRYRRTGCPFCDVQDEHRLAAVAVEGEDGLRIDYCEKCRGYLKTYDGQGSEDLLLADWTSLHLDVIARDRGLKRMAASLYEM